MLPGVFLELLDVDPNRLQRQRPELFVLGRDGVAAALQADALAVDGAVVPPRVEGSTLAVPAR
jgi:hypothetical protein